MGIASTRRVPSALTSTGPARGNQRGACGNQRKAEVMETGTPLNASRLRSVLTLLVTILSCILFVAAVTLLISLPDASTANAHGEGPPVVDTCLFVTAVVIPFTFVIVLATRPRRNR